MSYWLVTRNYVVPEYDCDKQALNAIDLWQDGMFLHRSLCGEIQHVWVWYAWPTILQPLW